MTVGDRYAAKDEAQDPSNHIGKILRLTRDGKPAPDNPEQGLLSGELDVVLVIEEGYEEAFSAGLPAPVQVMRDGSNNGASVLVRRTEQLLEAYGLGGSI